jgi:hypothetical protein
MSGIGSPAPGKPLFFVKEFFQFNAWRNYGRTKSGYNLKNYFQNSNTLSTIFFHTGKNNFTSTILTG